jgi:tetratricopeptide (TPR) repeat protein
MDSLRGPLAGGVSGWNAAGVAWAALIYYDAGQTSLAETMFARALEQEPGDPTVLQYHGEYLQRKGCFQESIGYLERAACARPEDADAWASLGDACWHLDQWEKARQYYLRAVSCHPGREQLGRIYYGLANVAEELQDWNEAARCWREAAERLPRDECVWYSLGNALLHAGDYQGAIEPLTRNLRMGSGRPAWTLYDMASAYYHLGHMRQAKVFCQRALRHEPNDSDALELLREVQRLSGK